MKVETIKAFFTYLTALVLVAGGLWIIYATRAEATASEVRLVIAGFVGSALTFLFSAEVASRATHAATASTAAGVASMPTVITTAGPPQATTVAPQVAPTPIQTDPLNGGSEDHETP